MSELTLYTSADDRQRNLTFKFVVTGLVATIVIVALITAGGYYLLRSYGLQGALSMLVEQVDSYSAGIEQGAAAPQSVSISPASRSEVGLTNAYALLGQHIYALEHVSQLALYDRNWSLQWASDKGFGFDSAKRTQLQYLLSGQGPRLVFDKNFMRFEAWIDVIKGIERKVPVSLTLLDQNGDTIGVAKLLINVDRELAGARTFGARLFAFVLLGNLILFLLLYYFFRNGVHTIEDQEQKLNQQISRLSNLLTVNKGMQQSMKTASARAVELNEQFLRRVGADLHDGPAQMLGYAVLRLNKISRLEVAQELGQEFHAIKEALDESLDEIRGISSGLVLPELENMSLEQCLRKVVALHGVKSNAEIAEYYRDIEGDIPLPVKITAYRFVQEGLNNSHRHGQAEKCRITAQVKDGVLHLSLKDNGMGFRMSQLNSRGGHLGLLGLKDRVESLGGKFSINSELGIGTALKISVSLVDADVV